jgi:hypothetical protein
MVVHVPPLSRSLAPSATTAIVSDAISMESLLVRSIYARTRARLAELNKQLAKSLKGIEVGRAFKWSDLSWH